MITVEYQPNIAETINASLCFLDKRPAIKFLMFSIKFYCLIISVVYLLKAISGTFNVRELLLLFLALSWIFGYRALNKIILKYLLTKQKIEQATKTIFLSPHRLSWQSFYNNQLMQQSWKKVKCIYQSHDGYIIPSTGFANAGKFTWLPKRGFNEPGAEQRFLDLLEQHHIKIKCA